MPTIKLDPIDRKILAELQTDGRMTNVELAKRVGISAPPCLPMIPLCRRPTAVGSSWLYPSPWSTTPVARPPQMEQNTEILYKPHPLCHELQGHAPWC